MFKRKLTEFTLNNSGAIGQALHHELHQTHAQSTAPFFFQPYKEQSQFWHKGLAILTAPFLLASYMLHCVIEFLSFGVQSLALFIQGETDKGGEHLVESILYLVVGLVTAGLAVTSPLINLFDWVGSGINSLRQTSDDHVAQASNTPSP